MDLAIFTELGLTHTGLGIRHVSDHCFSEVGMISFSYAFCSGISAKCLCVSGKQQDCLCHMCWGTPSSWPLPRPPLRCLLCLHCFEHLQAPFWSLPHLCVLFLDFLSFSFSFPVTKILCLWTTGSLWCGDDNCGFLAPCTLAPIKYAFYCQINLPKTYVFSLKIYSGDILLAA